MSNEENKALVRRLFEEALNQQQFSALDEVLAPDYVNHSMPAPAPGVAGFQQVIQMFLTAFPDMQVHLEDVLAEGDRVATRGTFTGTHQGPFQGIPPTGKPIRVAYIDVWRVADGKLCENWVQMDLPGLMQQLGVVPASGQASV